MGAATLIPVLREPKELPRIGVVIPYFQRESGLLHRALSSVAAQEYRPVQVVVVDDGSPRTAAEEVTPHLQNSLQRLTVVRQVNRGIAAARNAALDALSEDVSAIALLDSDDYWRPAHLRYAAAALSRGADFFFSNSATEGDPCDYFRTRPQRQVDFLGRAPPVEGAPSGLLRWPGSVSALFGAGLPFITSTAVFRRAVKPDLRFPTTYRRAAEDHAAFWELLTRSSFIVFCSEVTVVYGTGGVGTWQNSRFGSVASLARLSDEIRWHRELIRSDLLDPVDRRLVRRKVAERRNAALVCTLHLVRRRHRVVAELLHLFRSDPVCPAVWCINLPRLVWTKIRRGVSGG
jgi:succinoglycan biosynthesis protein ExoW